MAEKERIEIVDDRLLVEGDVERLRLNVNGGIAQEISGHRAREDELRDKLRLLADAFGVLLCDLQVVVPEAERATIDNGGKNQPDGGVIRPRPEQRGDEDAAVQQHAAHRRRAGFFAVQFEEAMHFLLRPHGLAELERNEAADGVVAENQREQKGGERRRDGPKGDVLKDVERAEIVRRGALAEPVEIVHHTACRPSTMRSMRAERLPLTSTTSPARAKERSDLQCLLDRIAVLHPARRRRVYAASVIQRASLADADNEIDAFFRGGRTDAAMAALGFAPEFAHAPEDRDAPPCRGHDGEAWKAPPRRNRDWHCKCRRARECRAKFSARGGPWSGAGANALGAFFQREAEDAAGGDGEQALRTMCSPGTGTSASRERPSASKREADAVKVRAQILRANVAALEADVNGIGVRARRDARRKLVIDILDEVTRPAGAPPPASLSRGRSPRGSADARCARGRYW